MKRLQNGIVTSDEDVSITGSPNIRRRLGSCSGGIVDQQSTKEEIYSPGTHDAKARIVLPSSLKIVITNCFPQMSRQTALFDAVEVGYLARTTTVI